VCARLRLRLPHPGVTLDQVRAQNGCELVVPDEIPTTEAPSAEELHFLRTRVDVDGALRKLG